MIMLVGSIKVGFAFVPKFIF